MITVGVRHSKLTIRDDASFGMHDGHYIERFSMVAKILMKDHNTE